MQLSLANLQVMLEESTRVLTDLPIDRGTIFCMPRRTSKRVFRIWVYVCQDFEVLSRLFLNFALVSRTNAWKSGCTLY